MNYSHNSLQLVKQISSNVTRVETKNSVDGENKFICRRNIGDQTKILFMEGGSVLVRLVTSNLLCKDILEDISESVHKALKVGNKEGADF